MDTDKSQEVTDTAPKIDRRAFLLALSGSAFVLASGALLAGCGGGGGGSNSPGSSSNSLGSSSSNSNSSSSLSSSSSSSSAGGGGIFAGQYTGSYSGNGDNGTVSFSVDSTGHIIAIIHDTTSGNTLNGTGTVNSAGSGVLTTSGQSLSVNFVGNFTMHPDGSVSVTGTYGGDASGTWFASTSASST